MAFFGGDLCVLVLRRGVPSRADFIIVILLAGLKVENFVMKFIIVWILGFLHLCKAQTSDFGNDRGLIHRRPRPIHQQSSPCWTRGSSEAYYDSVEEDAEGRKLLLAAGAAVGGAALGYHLGMKQKNPVIINNNIHNEYPSPCVLVQPGGGGGGGGVGGGGLVSGILGHHPILSSILQGGLWNGGGGGGNRLPVNRESNVNWNRAIRQFTRVVRPLARGFK